MRASFRWLLLFACVVCSSVVCSGAVSAATVERIRERGRLLVAVAHDDAPERIAHADPAQRDRRDFELGIVHAIAAKLLGNADRLELLRFGPQEQIAAVVAGKADLAISMLRATPRNLQQVDFSQPYYEAGVGVMQAVGGDIAEPAQLAGRRIGFIARGDGDAHALLTMPASPAPARLVGFEHFDAAAAALTAKEIDALFTESANIDVYVKRHLGRFVCSPPLAVEPVAIAVPKNEPALLAVVNAVIDELRASGKLDALQRAQGLR